MTWEIVVFILLGLIAAPCVLKCLDAARDNKTSPLGCWPGAAAVPTVPAS